LLHLMLFLINIKEKNRIYDGKKHQILACDE
jgi:hypothetical protein